MWANPFTLDFFLNEGQYKAGFMWGFLGGVWAVARKVERSSSGWRISGSIPDSCTQRIEVMATPDEQVAH